MTKEEIKSTYTMRDILQRCGLPQPNRAGFVKCPFHSGDRESSMKIYPRDFHCYGCGANGDIFGFIQKYHGLSFKEAFQMLGGTYEKPKYSSDMKIYRAEKEREMRQKKMEREKARIDLNNSLISIYRYFVNISEPLSDVWCDCYNKLQYQLYKHELLNEKRTEH